MEFGGLHFVGEITPAGIGIFTLLGTVVVALIKAWPVLALQAQTAREKLRGEHRSDLSDCKARIDTLQAELLLVREEVHRIEIKLVGALSAYRILDVEVTANLPTSSALAHARQVLAAAFALAADDDAQLEMPPDWGRV